VAQTLASQTAFRGGYRVVTDAHGNYLPRHAFVMQMIPGDYQNGASWLLYDSLALAVGFLQGVPDALANLWQRLRAEFQTGAVFHEFLDTNPDSPDYLGEPSWRDGFAWDSFIVVINHLVQRACSRTYPSARLALVAVHDTQHWGARPVLHWKSQV
jgi:hypothetical protein